MLHAKTSSDIFIILLTYMYMYDGIMYNAYIRMVLTAYLLHLYFDMMHLIQTQVALYKIKIRNSMLLF